MNDAEIQVKYEKLLAEKKKEERKEEVWALFVGIAILVVMGATYVHFGTLAYTSLMEAGTAFPLATTFTLVIIFFAVSTFRAFKIVFKKKAEK